MKLIKRTHAKMANSDKKVELIDVALKNLNKEFQGKLVSNLLPCKT